MSNRQIIDLFTRIDDLLRQLLEVQKTELEILRGIREQLPVAPPPPPVIPAVPAPPERPPVERVVTPIEFIEELSRRLVKTPNRLERISFDTINENWISLKREGKIKTDVALGFWIEQVGGGFDYIIRKDGFGAAEKTAEIDDRWEIEFDDLVVRGYGVSGQALIWYWWRED